MKENLAKVIGSPEDFNSDIEGDITVAYPMINFGEGDGISQLFCTLMGGQMDIDNIQRLSTMVVNYMGLHVITDLYPCLTFTKRYPTPHHDNPRPVNTSQDRQQTL